eukprot:1265768-Pyramimonas_sp.AAC.1
MGPRGIATLFFCRSTGDDADRPGGVDRCAAPCCPEVQYSFANGNLSCLFAPAGPAEVTADYDSDTEVEVPREPHVPGPQGKVQVMECDAKDYAAF